MRVHQLLVSAAPLVHLALPLAGAAANGAGLAARHDVDSRQSASQQSAAAQETPEAQQTPEAQHPTTQPHEPPWITALRTVNPQQADRAARFHQQRLQEQLEGQSHPTLETETETETGTETETKSKSTSSSSSKTKTDIETQPLGQYVYKAEFRSPRQVRRSGGLRPIGEDWDSDYMAYRLARHYGTPINGRGLEDQAGEYLPYRVYRDAYVSVHLSIETTVSFRDNGEPAWIFEIRATANILNDDWPEGECAALGGVHWYQIRRYRQARAGAPWLYNPEYDVKWFENPRFRSHYRVSRAADSGLPPSLRSQDDDDNNLLPSDAGANESSNAMLSPTEKVRIKDLRGVVQWWMDRRTESEISGFRVHFPPVFVSLDETNDPNVPGPSRLQSPDEMRWQDREVVATIQRYADMGEEGLLRLLPNSSFMIHLWFNLVALGRCRTWPSQPKWLGRRSLVSRATDKGSDELESKLNMCTMLHTRLRTLLYRSQVEKKSTPSQEEKRAGISARDLKRLREGDFDGLDCTAKVDLVERWAFGKTRGASPLADASPWNGAQNRDGDDDDGYGANDEDCARAFELIQGPKPRQALASLPSRSEQLVFVASALSPAEVRARGGFFPPLEAPPNLFNEIGVLGTADDDDDDNNNGLSQEKKSRGKWNHYLVPAYTTLGKAAKHAAELAHSETKRLAAELAANKTKHVPADALTYEMTRLAADEAVRETKNLTGVVYAVHATDNMVVRGHRAVAVGGILWSQVFSWMTVPVRYRPPGREVASKHRGMMRGHFERLFQSKAIQKLFTNNTEYDHGFDAFHSTTHFSQNMTDVARDLVAFMNEHGRPVGWTGSFPLRAAPPHPRPAAHEDESIFGKVGDFFKEHSLALAIAALPAVLLLHVIPPLGAAADAAELALLAAETTEAIEMEEAGWMTMKEVGDGMAELMKGADGLMVT